MPYAKLDSGIVLSTIWAEPDHVLRMWIALLATANRHGEVLGSVPGMAHLARISLEQAEDALARLGSPDRHSRSPEKEGRRIEAIPGGWWLVNYEQYREKENTDDRRAKAAARQKRYRERRVAVGDRRDTVSKPDDSNAESNAVTSPVTKSDDKQRQRQRQKQTTPSRGADAPESDFLAAWEAYPTRPGNSRAAALRAWRARRKEGVPADAMLAGVRAYAAHCQREGTEPRYVKMAATFFGPGRHWESDYGQAQAEADGWNPDGTIRTYTPDGLSFTPAFLAATGQKAPT